MRRPQPQSAAAAPLAAMVLASACGSSGSDNAAPTFAQVEDQTISEGGSLTVDLTPLISDPEDDRIEVAVTAGPGSATTTQVSPTFVRHQFHYRDEVDVDIDDDDFTVEVTARDLDGGRSSSVRFRITQLDTAPTVLDPSPLMLSSGVAAQLIDYCIDYSWEYQREQTGVALDDSGSAHVLYQTTGWTPVLAHVYEGTWVRRAYGAFEASYVSMHFDEEGIGHLSFDQGAGGEDLAYIRFEESRWGEPLTINRGASVGLESDLTLDRDGNVHIAHFAWTEDTVGYATNAHGPWNIYDDLAPAAWDQTSVATDAVGKPHIVYVTPAGVVSHLTNASGSWERSEIEPGSNPVVRSDEQGELHVVFNHGTLHYGRRDASGDWTIDPIVGSVHARSQQLSAQLKNGRMHVVHVNGPLYYSTNRSGSWRTFVVDAGADYQNPDIAIAKNGDIHISAMQNARQVLHTSFSPSFFLND